MAPDDQIIEAMARAMQEENRPENDYMNGEQRSATNYKTLPAYKALARAALVVAKPLLAEQFAEERDALRAELAKLIMGRDAIFKAGAKHGRENI